tara:strand:- start:132 stop:440 length:309 start_codon:yes stop_codon:yes gene_type:complete
MSSPHLTTLKWEDTGELAIDDRIKEVVNQVMQVNPPLEVISSTEVVVKMRAYGEEIRALKSWLDTGTLSLKDYKRAVAEITHEIVSLLTTVATEKLQVQTNV